jgi:tRNA pseudouridine38-40 synthase
MRYFLEIAYKGTNYAGWQKQPNAIGVQQVMEDVLSTILRHPIEVVGCGRTDAGVHASQFIMHFDSRNHPEERFIRQLNALLPQDIAALSFRQVGQDAHARFDALERSYEYRVIKRKSPFLQDLAFLYHDHKRLNFDTLNRAASIILEYDSFFPFCKTRSDAKTMHCKILRSAWVEEQEMLIFHISANRFLRGMVRLIVGMCINVCNGEISLDEVRSALDEQRRLSRDWSVPACGLFLTSIRY